MIIDISTFLFSCAIAIWGSFSFAPATSGWDFYKPILVFHGAYIIAIAIWWIVIDGISRELCIHKEKHMNSRIAKFLLRNGIQYINNHALCIVSIKGREAIPTEERFLFVSNHVSNFDPMLAYGYLTKNHIAFISKRSNMEHIPLAKRLMPLVNFQAIDRDDPLQSLEVMRNSAELIKNNITSIGVYPEGTRNREKLGDFHEGVFSIAKMAKCPIVVSCIKGSEKIGKNAPLKPTRVKLEIVEVLPYESFEDKPVKQISDEVKQMITDALEDN